MYTYEDFKDITTEDVFNSKNAECLKYLKIGVGKGIITWEDVVDLFEFYNGCKSDGDYDYKDQIQ